MAVADAGQRCRAVGDWVGLVVNGLCIFSVFPHSGNSQGQQFIIGDPVCACQRDCAWRFFLNENLLTRHLIGMMVIGLGLLAIDGRILQLLARLRRG